MPIRIFVTGGTFDKEYNELNGTLFFQDTHVPEMLKLGRCLEDVDVRTLMMVDSAQMTEADRQIILHNCESCNVDRIIITHGTDTMEITARILGQRIKDKTVVLTGAMVPYRFGSSDGMFNLGSALAFVQSLEPGVYVVMNGKCFDWHNVRKNQAVGQFERLAPKG
jgi:L-asparaginase